MLHAGAQEEVIQVKNVSSSSKSSAVYQAGQSTVLYHVFIPMFVSLGTIWGFSGCAGFNVSIVLFYDFNIV